MNTQDSIRQLEANLSQQVIGQKKLVNRLLIALLSDGHLLVEGAPGLAKTRAIHCLSNMIECDYQRIQFTPDLLPADLTGAEIYHPEKHQFSFEKGPLFNSLLLADEINRAPAKVQSALLEAMSDKQISIAKHSYALPDLFLVMATQNPIEQEGTYALPEAQLDRFLLKTHVSYPSRDDELKILQLVHNQKINPAQETHFKLKPETLFQARKEVLQTHISDALHSYIIELIFATRDGARYDENLPRWIRHGASPRATLALAIASRAHAWLQGRDHVNPEDIQALLPDILRHRIILSFDAIASSIQVKDVIERIIARVRVP